MLLRRLKLCHLCLGVIKDAANEAITSYRLSRIATRLKLSGFNIQRSNASGLVMLILIKVLCRVKNIFSHLLAVNTETEIKA